MELVHTIYRETDICLLASSGSDPNFLLWICQFHTVEDFLDDQLGVLDLFRIFLYQNHWYLSSYPQSALQG